MTTRIPARRPRGYPWVRPRPSGPWRVAWLTVVIGAGSTYLSVSAWMARSDDLAPDSPFGYACALLATACLVASAVGYWRRKRSGRPAGARLASAVAAHAALGLLAVVFALAHAWGNYQPKTGTYALYGLLLLAWSGLVGRALDVLAPRAAAAAAARGYRDWRVGLPVATVRAWRRLHALLVVASLALVAWHVEFALTLLWAARR